VATTAAIPEVVRPTAEQSSVVGQDNAWSWLIPLGALSAIQVMPPSVVATTAAVSASPFEVYPDAQQSVLVGHDTASSSLVDALMIASGRVSDSQLLPSEVATTAATPDPSPPTAQQSVLVGQERPSTMPLVISLGRLWACQLLPPFTVARTVGTVSASVSV
jgi:hypothetical protein